MHDLLLTIDCIWHSFGIVLAVSTNWVLPKLWGNPTGPFGDAYPASWSLNGLDGGSHHWWSAPWFSSCGVAVVVLVILMQPSDFHKRYTLGHHSNMITFSLGRRSFWWYTLTFHGDFRSILGRAHFGAWICTQALVYVVDNERLINNPQSYQLQS